MNIGRIISLGTILIMLQVTSCRPDLKNGAPVMVSQQLIKKYWKCNNCVILADSVSLKDRNSSLTSKFILRNFTLSARIKTTAGAEGALLFHVKTNSPEALTGYSMMLNNRDYRIGNPQKTGSLSLIRNNFVRSASDNKWFVLFLSVKGNHITISVDNKIISEYIQPENPSRIRDLEGRILSKGLIKLEKTSDTGIILLNEIKIESLPDDLAFENPDPLTTDSTGEFINLLNQQGFPVIDYHGHLKGGLTIDQILQHGHNSGYNYGIAPNCGLHFPVTNDSTLSEYYDQIKHEPVFKAMQCEGREWIKLFTPEIIARYDYIFTDAMTWTDHKGRRLRLWIPEETFVDDEQQFMDMLVAKIEAILSQEPVDIYVNPTFLPPALAASYDRLWTAERMDRVINVLKENDVALEINARYKLPGVAFIKKAKEAGVKFTFGTNNADNNDLNRLEYCLEIIHEAGLTAKDMFLPRPSDDKKVLKKGLPAMITG